MRLKSSLAGGRFSFICTPDQAKKMHRVIAYADGRVVSQDSIPEGTLFVVEKT